MQEACRKELSSLPAWLTRTIIRLWITSLSKPESPQFQWLVLQQELPWQCPGSFILEKKNNPNTFYLCIYSTKIRPVLHIHSCSITNNSNQVQNFTLKKKNHWWLNHNANNLPWPLIKHVNFKVWPTPKCKWTIFAYAFWMTCSSARNVASGGVLVQYADVISSFNFQ